MCCFITVVGLLCVQYPVKLFTLFASLIFFCSVTLQPGIEMGFLLDMKHLIKMQLLIT